MHGRNQILRSIPIHILLLSLCLGTQVIPARADTLSPIDRDLLDDISRRSFRYFWENTAPVTGLTLDRALAQGKADHKHGGEQVASIAATGFGLTAFCIA